MKKLEIIIKPEKLESLKNILDDCEASGLMITNIMGYGNQKGYTRMYRGTTYNVNLLPKVKVETVVADDVAEKIVDRVVKEISTGNYGDGKIFIYNIEDVASYPYRRTRCRCDLSIQSADCIFKLALALRHFVCFEVIVNTFYFPNKVLS